MTEPFAPIHDAVSAYYTGKLAEHGATPQGVDWNSQDAQDVRLAQLLRICEGERDFSLIDYGCGYGRLYELLAARDVGCEYRGYDLSAAMIAAARERLGDAPACGLHVGAPGDEAADYTVASGIFNVRGTFSVAEWEPYVCETVQHMARLSRRGFAFNCLTGYADPEYKRDDLYYADPGKMFDYCVREFSRHAALLHDYGLYEFTVLVRT